MPARTVVWCVALWLGSLALAADGWPAFPAVVNPVCRSALRATVSLDGPWEFVTDARQRGEVERWFAPGTSWPDSVNLQVPGCWEAQGIGGPGNSSTVTPERSIRPLRGAYVGTGWYRKRVTLPRAWTGQQVWLKLGGVHAQGWFWVNGVFLGQIASYCGAYQYNITDLVRPGEIAVIVAKVRNDVPSRKGLMSWIHRFGGLYRSVELEATAPTFIANAYVEGDLDGGRALVHVRLGAIDPPEHAPPALLRVSVTTLAGQPAGGAQQLVHVTDPAQAETTLAVPLAPLQPWSPEEPNLYRAQIVLSLAGQPVDGWDERFGVRRWEVRDGRFYLNHRPYFIRGFGDDHVYPLTLCSPASREVHKQHLRLAKSYGFAYVRHHTHCEVPEYYEAADEVGIMLQPELPYYGNQPSASAPELFRPKEDLEELAAHYRRYVSLATYCTGNEGHLGAPLDREVYQLAKRLDPTRLALHQDGGQNTRENADFYQGPVTPWLPGTQDAAWPFDAHEYLNLATEEDPRLAPKYRGAVRPPVTPEDFRAALARTGLSWDWGLATLDAGNQLQRVFQKRGLEQARLDPDCDGYIYWTIVDVGSPAAQGLFNQFWEPKASSAAFFRQFNSPTVLLAKFTPPERILRAGDELKVEWWLSCFGAGGVPDRALTWRLSNGERTVASGAIKSIRPAPGEVRLLGASTLRVPELRTPTRLQLRATLEGLPISNSWDLWAFPRPTAATNDGRGLVASTRVFASLKDRYPGLTEGNGWPALPADATEAARRPRVLVTDRLDKTAVAALDAGASVLLVGLPGVAPGVQLGWWTISAQAGTAIARHPAFGDFPHTGYLDELWFRLMGSALPATEAALKEVEPLMVGRGAAGYLLDAFQARAGRGKLLATGLKVLSDQPEATWLLAAFLRYVRSSAFQPRGSFDPAHPGEAWRELLALADRLNGWSETLHAAEREPYGSFLGLRPMGVARQTDGASAVTWRTQPAPDTLEPNRPFTFTWVAGLGYVSQPAGKFSLFAGDEPLLEFELARQDATWRSADGRVTLKYIVKSSDPEDTSGLMELTLSGPRLVPGRPLLLRVVGSASQSRRWFGLYEAP